MRRVLPSVSRPPRGSTALRRPGSSSLRPGNGASSSHPPPRGRPARAAVLVLVGLLLLMSYTSSLRAWLQQRSEIQATRDEIAASQARIEELRIEKERWNDPAYVQQQARERFGWVLPGETGYRVLDEDGQPLETAAELDEAPQSEGSPWYVSVWDSIRVAGQPSGPSGSGDPGPVIRPPRKAGRSG